jgi:hypothetical protein
MRRGRVIEDEGRNWQQAIGIALGLAVLGLVGGYLGFLHPLGDSLSVGRGIAAVAVLILAVFASFAGLRMAAFVSMLLALLTGAQVLMAYTWPGVPGRYTVYQKNLYHRNAELAALEADIRAAEAQIVTLQEVSAGNLPMVDNLQDLYPTRHLCPGRAVGGPAILTRLEAVPGRPSAARTWPRCRWWRGKSGSGSSRSTCTGPGPTSRPIMSSSCCRSSTGWKARW